MCYSWHDLPNRLQKGNIVEELISKDAYNGAREDLAIWKKRALKAETLNRSLLKDAARYHYLRDRCTTGEAVGGGDIAVEVSFTHEINDTKCGRWPNAVDASIDAAILDLENT